MPGAILARASCPAKLTGGFSTPSCLPEDALDAQGARGARHSLDVEGDAVGAVVGSVMGRQFTLGSMSAVATATS